MSGIMMLKHLGERPAAFSIEAALERVYRDGKNVTRDVGGTAGTKEFTDAVIAALAPVPASR
jgi:isocitrate dehydrogenase (NAD+)